MDEKSKKSRKGQKLSKNDEVSMDKAVQLVLDGATSIRKAAVLQNIPFQTLARYVKKQKSSTEKIRMFPNYEIRKIFNTDQENCLSDYITKCAQMFYGLPLLECRQVAYEMAIENNIRVPKNWEFQKLAGEKWMRGFMRRHPTLSLRTPEGCSLSRASSFNKHNVSLFFDKLADVYSRNPHFKDGTRVFNLDETAALTVQNKQGKVVALKGSRQVSKVTSAERGTLVTTCCIISAAGTWLPPAMIFPRVHFKPHMLHGAPPGTLGLASKSGWMNNELFVDVLKHFIKHSNSSKQSPSMLLYDNHESHISLAAINIAKENGITVITFPPHSTHKLQPLDVGVFKAFQAYYSRAIDSWMMHHPGQTMSIYEVAHCVGQAHEKCMVPGTITNAFKATGIAPYNRDIFIDADFLGSFVTDRPLKEAATNASSLPSTSSNGLNDLNGSSTQDNHSLQNLDQPTNGFQKIDSTFKSPEQIRGFPKAKPRTQLRARRKGKCMIATDTPEKEEIEKRLKERKDSVKKNKTVKRKVALDSSSSSESEVSLVLEDSDSNEEFEENLPNKAILQFGKLSKSPNTNEYLLVEFDTKGAKVYYIAQVLEEENSQGEVRVSFLRRSAKMVGKFIFPDVPDVQYVDKKDIKLVLPEAIICGKTKRQLSFLSFDMNFDGLDLR